MCIQAREYLRIKARQRIHETDISSIFLCATETVFDATKTTISFLATTRLITMKMVMAIGIAQEIVKMKMIQLHLNYLFSQQIIYESLTTIKQSQFHDDNILIDFFIINFKAKFTLMKMYNINLNENALEETLTKGLRAPSIRTQSQKMAKRSLNIYQTPVLVNTAMRKYNRIMILIPKQTQK